MKKVMPLAMLWILAATISRLIPHAPNATLITTSCLLANLFFTRTQSILIMLIALVLSDFGLHLIYNQPAFGEWTLFTYSGWLFVTLVGIKNTQLTNLLKGSLSAGFGFWAWTNFGTWAGNNGLYTETLNGLTTCYIAGIPFLENTLVASMIAAVAVSLIFKKLDEYKWLPQLQRNP